MLTPTNFAIHVTYQCPLTCAHCCFSSGPSVTDSLPVDTILDTIRLLDTDTIKMVAFTGGEAILLGARLLDAIALAHDRGFVTRLVSSAYWARTRDAAARRIAGLRESGLDELSISWDDFHAEQTTMPMRFDYVRFAFEAAKSAGMTAAISIVQDRDTTWTAARVLSELNLPADSTEVIVESPLNFTGRAREQLSAALPRSERHLGPCPYVLTGPTLSAKSKLLACCGVIPDTPALCLMDRYDPANLDAAIKAGLESPLLNWLHLRGPYAIMESISQSHGVPIPSKDAIGGNCEACHLLFATPGIRERVEQAAHDRADEIFGEVAVLEALGLLTGGDRRGLFDLWNDVSVVRSGAPDFGPSGAEVAHT